jgi:translation initiation factor 2 subunit 1
MVSLHNVKRTIALTVLVLTSQCLDKTAGIATLEQSIKDIEKSITAAGGSCIVKMAPKAVTENDDAELAALMEKRERENQEVSGDEDESTSDEGGVVEADT